MKKERKIFMETKLTDNQVKILNIMEEKFPQGAVADEVVKELPDSTVASVRATLTSLATKGHLNKTKVVYEGKEKTNYIPKVHQD